MPTPSIQEKTAGGDGRWGFPDVCDMIITHHHRAELPSVVVHGIMKATVDAGEAEIGLDLQLNQMTYPEIGLVT